MRKIQFLATVIVFAAFANSAALAQGGVADRMKSTGAVTIGYRADQFPFAYESSDRKPIGYTLDLCRRVVEMVQSQLGLQPMRIRYVALNPGNRIAMVANGTVDMECDLSTDTAGREDQVAFLDPTYIGSTKVLTLASSGIAATHGLSGKRLLVVAGSSNVQIASQLNGDRRLNMKIVPMKDGPEALRTLDKGGGDAWISSDVLIYGAIAQTSNPAIYRVLDESLSTRTYGIMVRLQDSAFKELAKKALRAMVKSGEFERTYRLWFESPIEPGGVNLKLPIGVALRDG